MAALNRLAEVIQEVAGGEILPIVEDVYPRRPLKRKILLRTNYVHQIMGIDLPRNFIPDSLKRLGWPSELKKPGEYAVLPPTNRLDVERNSVRLLLLAMMIGGLFQALAIPDAFKLSADAIAFAASGGPLGAGVPQA